MHALPVQTDTPPLAFDLPLAVEPGADTYQLHQHLEGRFGPRAETGYLWTLANANQPCLARCPGIKAGLQSVEHTISSLRDANELA